MAIQTQLKSKKHMDGVRVRRDRPVKLSFTDDEMNALTREAAKLSVEPAVCARILVLRGLGLLPKEA